jgi:predicted PurR-regulated permease PerM
MSRGDRLALLTPIIILVIAVVFLYLTTMLLSWLGASFIVFAWIIALLASFFFAVLGVFGLILAFVLLSDCIHRYAVIREKRETERMIQRHQILPRRDRITGGTFSYRPRQIQVRQQQPDNNADNGC